MVEGENPIVRITGAENQGRCLSLLIHGSNNLLLDETERSIHDALCVVRSIVKLKYIIPGGAAPETELYYKLSQFSKTLEGMESYCVL